MLIIAYLLGSIPSGVMIGKKFFNVDIRKAGSGNIGTTNTFRVLGPKAGTVVLLMDVLKGTLAASQPYLFQTPNVNPLLIGLAAILGHTFSIFDHFNGGKAVATSAGILLAYNPPFFIVACIIFASLVYLTSMVSVASMTALVLISLLSLFYHDWILTTVAVVLTVFIFYRHRENIKRLKNGTESLIPFGYWYNHKKKS
ncbi:glycerol-3-phosphate 1-O-acyltransferase PlsY [Pediococcus inopinatus]|uniref:Glycerol-3-phosphate acyltransferase n=1 Tax=Pediococcus inopinatus TaxID=114090 RepID=A0ABZ0Q6P5_9LACO|nr:glycerol-3-phosphate 1-O-acyltransferase PlsY [Pediococcus inopinatus]AVL01060.1 acyl-phosphate glycerol 3-phosphate acyltransferase [Pediococcus inopinatus]WPC18364.1 glycerol-3-phosphate 1-O-acyltransferase PlsY [Pediococcus inopinatus]WPC20586.1 glycerol-3-phosphate 1-O-acyltransferase PlsY [Pediococcus inopinatus]WPC22621.1 glycerol-3-phosphate 1-O-acyltransferase PlsY [Pediococcus inopinatus]WPP10195.1 glycerol-3-phosphate 1-O-acyltransferase PlsY [Pediococcus inopinatus]